MKTRILAAVVALAGAAYAAPVTRQQLVEMARGKVDPSVMRAIVERDCVDFEIDAGNAAELSKTVPAAVLEAAIACRRAAASASAASVPDQPADARPAPSAPATVSVPTSASAPAAVPSAPPAAAAPPPAASPSPARIRLRAVFIGESEALRCAATIDGVEAATLVKEAQGAFGEAVLRDALPRESPYLPVGAGRHRVAFRCDPKREEVTAEVEVPAGESRTVEVAETTLRHWKLRRILTP